jgi:hypothetical protein
MKLFDDYVAAIEAVHQYFGYVEDWVVIPLDDGREYFWYLQGGEADGARLCYAKTERELGLEEGDYYESPVYTQRHLPRWVYRAADYTMVSIDTQTDGNKFLIVLDNSKERPK